MIIHSKSYLPPLQSRSYWNVLGGVLLVGGMACTSALAAPVPFTGSYAQNFDGLASGTAWSNGESPLLGWSLFKHDTTSSVIAYTVGTGSSNAGGFYSFGEAGSPDRALGVLISNGAFNPTPQGLAGWMALALRNDTPGIIDALSVHFSGEQWRYGANVNTQTMTLEYGMGDTFEGVTNWKAAGDSFSWTSPLTGAATATYGAGNTTGRVSNVGGDLRGLDWRVGQTLWLRWVQTKVSSGGSNHGMAIDDLSVQLAGADTVAPTLVSSVPANAASDVAMATSSFTLNFSETVQPASGSFELRQGSTVLATIPVTDTAKASFSGATLTLKPGVQLAANTAYSITPVGTPVQDASGNAWSVTTLNFTTGAAPAITRIHEIQGAGEASPLLGREVTINGVVTGFAPGLSGFYVQEEERNYDQDAGTSEGILVYFGTKNPGVDGGTVGKRVQVSGTVDEYNRQTQLKQVTAFQIQGDGELPKPVDITLPISDAALWERYEGMLVKISSATAGGKLVVSDNYTLGRYGDVTLSADKVLPQFTEESEPSTTGFTAYAKTMERSQIILDDLSSAQNPATVRGRNGQPLSATNTLRAGDGVDAVVGVIDQFYQQSAQPEIYQTTYRVQPTTPLSFIGPARPTQADLQTAVGVAGVKVASANVLNFFSKVGDTSTNTKDVFTTPLGNSIGIRGANNAVELERQKAKVVANLIGMQADVYGLMEVQNNGFGADSALYLLVDAMNQSADKPKGAVYDYVKAPFNQGGSSTIAGAGTDAITVAIVYRSDRVTPVGGAAVPDVAHYDAFTPNVGGARVPIAQTFSVPTAAGAEQFTLVVNHFKSKGSLLATGGNQDMGDGQGNNNPARVKTATQLKDWLATKPTGSQSANVILVGDFNAYSKEAPVAYLETNGFTKVSHGYSYSFDGLWGSLDHIFVSTNLVSKVGNVVKWAINAEEPPVLDYNQEYKSPAQIADYYAATAYRSSDHNPIVMGLNFDALPTNKPPVIKGVPADGVSAVVGQGVSLAALSVEDADSELLTLTLTTTNGALQGADDADAQAAGTQIKGTAAQISAALAKASFVPSAEGDASLGLSLSDGVNAAVTANYAFKVSAVVNPGTHFELSPGGGGSVTGQLQGAGCTLAAQPSFVTAQSLGITEMPIPGAKLPNGLMVLNAKGCTANGELTVTMNYSQALPEGSQLWKWGRTADNQNKHWYRIPSSVQGQQVSFTLRDGGLGDDDLTADGNIVDPTAVVVPQAVNPGTGNAVAVPALNLWGLLMLALSFLPFAPLARRFGGKRSLGE